MCVINHVLTILIIRLSSGFVCNMAKSALVFLVVAAVFLQNVEVSDAIFSYSVSESS